ncbi:hypothetical protein K443DRAFT_675348 [Laccaria amethystina LaAM-08-1]|uniref:Zinc finger PHD-type domain-containing protein n=1 Tax=Laccaria amethystina LaAM-08-1 TaxID=1095629 RepID=A0A0C9YAY2_9AGAR|nr:hypothetical protein K443DRAFT_675348 [Laccaria amethystina LaAM-08-1]
MKGKKAPKEPPEHDASSTRWCLECKISIGLSFAGEKNWTQHIDSAAHKTNARKAAAIPSKRISSFFTKTATPTASSSTHTSALVPIHIFPKLPIRQPFHPAPLPGDLHPIEFGETLSARTTLLNRFKAAIDSLPLSVPMGINSDDLAAFSGNPAALIGPDDEPWEILDQVLNRLVGYGATPEGISSIIRRGQFGMDGMYHWVKACIEDLHIGEPLLEGKIERLIEAMEFISPVPVTEHVPEPVLILGPSQEPQPLISEHASPEVFEIEDDTPTIRHEIAKPQVPCRGYELKLPDSLCADEGCETVIEERDLLRCGACNLVYHLTCRGLIERPGGGWFCDDECKANAGGRVVSTRKRRRRV